MSNTTFEIASRDEWLKMRSIDVTSSEAAALFNLSPYSTEFELWHRKRSGSITEIEQDDRMKWGNRLEAPIALGVGEDYGVHVEPFKVYMRNASRMGSSFDFKIVGVNEMTGVPEILRELFRELGPGILEVKNVDWLQHKRNWTDESADQMAEAPAHIEIQVQHQLHVAELEWAAIAALVGGNEISLIIRRRDRSVGIVIEQKIQEFWRSVDADTAPAIKWERDAAFVASLYSICDGEVIDLSEDNDLASLAEDYRQASETMKGAEASKSVAKARMLQKIGGAKKVIGRGYSISASNIAPTTYTVERAGYRDFRINWKKVS
jgi:putative phage-type endonuclease